MSAPWGQGDLFSTGTGIVTLALGLTFRPKHRDIQSATVLLATGISLGPLILILLDPAAQAFGYQKSLLEIVLGEGRATLWWAAAVAALYLIRDLI